jgi:hypothetical protein
MMKTKLENTIAENKSKFKKVFAIIDQNALKPVELSEFQKKIIESRVK